MFPNSALDGKSLLEKVCKNTSSDAGLRAL